MSDRSLQRGGAVALVVASLGFVTIFIYLARVFGYPDVLDRPAAEVLPALAGGGAPLRTAWLVYAALPGALLMGGLASMSFVERATGRTAARLAALLASVAALSMMAGLLRWPSLHWELARRWASAGPEQRDVLAAIFDGANLYLGNVFGEFIGEVALSGWFAICGAAFSRAGRRVAGTAGTLAAAIGFASAFRQITHVVDPIAELNNVVLPLWLIVLGVLLWRSSGLTPERTRGTTAASVPSSA